VTANGDRTTSSFEGTREEILKRRAESLALESVGEEVTDRSSMLLFRIGEEWYAIRVESVREIFQEYEVTVIPCTPPFILGVTNVRGEILSVTDPAVLTGLGSVVGTDGLQPPAIVVAQAGVCTAVVVDEIGDILEVPNSAVEPPVSIIDRTQAEFVAGSVCVNDMMVGLINVERVLEPVGSTGRH
jgi:purine-binding chemotaxis protein CheW